MGLDPKYKAVCFDMDGTFMNTKVDYIKLADVIFDELVNCGVPASSIIRTEGAKREIDSGIEWLTENGMADKICDIHSQISNRSTEIEMEHAEISRPFHNATETVTALRERGYKTGILTRGGHSYAEYILKKSNVVDLFDVVVARDDFPEEESKPSPISMVNLGKALGVKPEEILYLGDNKIDWLAARDSGAGFYGVLTGNLSYDDWIELDPKIEIIEGIFSLLDMIE